jgi:hypothetical protein
MAQRFEDLHPGDWLAGRRAGVPVTMVEAATRHRRAGDWRAACASGWVDAHIDLDRVRNEHGGQTADQIERDLVHLVPDLLHWHLHDYWAYQSRGGVAQHAGDLSAGGLLRPGQTVTLATYGAVSLAARTPASTRPQRIQLRCVARGPAWARRPGTGHLDWTQARYLWDARQTDRLRQRVGGGDRTPFFHRDGRPRSADELAAATDTPLRTDDAAALTERVLTLQDAGLVEEAWRLGGCPGRGELVHPWQREKGRRLPECMAAVVPVLVPVARAMLTATGAPRCLVLEPLRDWTRSSRGIAVQIEDGELRAFQVHGEDAPWLGQLPREVWRRMPDLELLRAGLLTAPELHPLVRAALFPDQPDPGYHPRAGSPGPAG